MSGLFNLLHKPPQKKDSSEESNQIKEEQQPQILKDKSADEFEEVEDQEVDGLFFDELSPCDNSGVVSNIAIANINQDIEEIDPALQNQPLESLGLDAQNFQALMNNPALTQHLISVLTSNLQKTEQQKKQNQATPVFSYGEIMKNQLQNDRKSKEQEQVVQQLLQQYNQPQLQVPEKKPNSNPMMLPVSAFKKKKTQHTVPSNKK